MYLLHPSLLTWPHTHIMWDLSSPISGIELMPSALLVLTIGMPGKSHILHSSLHGGFLYFSTHIMEDPKIYNSSAQATHQNSSLKISKKGHVFQVIHLKYQITVT